MEEKSKYFTVDCVQAMNEAFKYSKEKNQEFITVDTFMMFLSQTNKGKEIFKAMGLDYNHFVSAIKSFLEDNIPKNIQKENPKWTISLKELRDRSIVLQQANGHKNKVDVGFILVSLYELNDNELFTRKYLNYFEITRFDIMSYIANNKIKNNNENNENNETKEVSKNYLNKYAINLNKKAQNGGIDNIIGRQKEIDRVIEILSQRRKNNPILIGEPGVGKTAITEGLAKLIVDGSVPENIKNFQLYNLDITSILAGTKYRGEFEERLKQIIKEASSDKNIILIIDEVHNLIGSGSSSMDASNILKPYLSSGEIKVIGATTYEEYRKYFEKEGALSRRFQKVEVLEPTVEQSIEILTGSQLKYEEYHGVQYTKEAIVCAVNLSYKYINDRKLPDKAFDVIDIAGSKLKLNFSINKKIVDEEKIKEIISEMAKIPLNAVNETEKTKLKNLELILKTEIFGQDQAIENTVNNILFSRSNLINREKPIGSFLFAGPSGVGKTELAKQLAQKLNISFVRFDMSEYMEKHSVSRLVGSPPGYIGYEQGGQLTEAIRKTPHCVLLLDEIEKANTDIYNILLQIMDYATLTDNDGKKADFKNVILIMTTNLGASEISKNNIGFTKFESVNKDREQQIKKHFSSEFSNRLDSIIQFNPLDINNIINIIKKQTVKLQKSLLEKKVISVFTEKALNIIAKKGFDEKLGARPIERYIEKNISQLLAKEILFGKLEQGGEIIIDDKDGNLEIVYNHLYSEDVLDQIKVEIKNDKPKKLNKKLSSNKEILDLRNNMLK